MVVEVSPGLYEIDQTLDANRLHTADGAALKAVTLRSKDGPEATEIRLLAQADTDLSVVTLKSGEQGSVLEGFTISGGPEWRAVGGRSTRRRAGLPSHAKPARPPVHRRHCDGGRFLGLRERGC